jgi:hypothetical protein
MQFGWVPRSEVAAFTGGLNGGGNFERLANMACISAPLSLGGAAAPAFGTILTPSRSAHARMRERRREEGGELPLK